MKKDRLITANGCGYFTAFVHCPLPTTKHGADDTPKHDACHDPSIIFLSFTFFLITHS